MSLYSELRMPYALVMGDEASCKLYYEQTQQALARIAELEKIIESSVSLADTKRLDKLQALTTGYGYGWLLRKSIMDRGIRLHESTQVGAVPDVRQAIDNYIE